jgi:hypothetical protein
MALIKFGAGIVEIVGSIAGVVHARNRYGNYARPRTKPTNPKSTRQSAARANIQQLTDYWNSANMSDAQRKAWNTYASAIVWTNKLGEKTSLTGFNMFIRSNAAILAIGGSIMTNAPTILSLPGADPTFAMTADAGTGLLTLAFDATQDWCKETGGYLSIDMGEPQLATRNYFGGPWRKAGALAGNTGSPITSPQTMVAPFTLVAGQKIWVRAAIIRADARMSNQFNAPAEIVGGLLNKYTLAGTLSPDSTGEYDLKGAFNGQAYYKNKTKTYYMWWDANTTWYISVVLGTLGTAYWQRANASPVGTFTHEGTATGDGTLS